MKPALDDKQPYPPGGPLREASARLRWALALVLVGVAVWLRLPTWNDHILFIDEPIYHSFALRLDLPGAHVYTDTADQKPPLGLLTYWLAIQISPEHAIAVVHLFTAIAIAATAVLLVAGSSTFLGSPWAGFWGGLLYMLISTSAAPNQELVLAFSSLEHFQAPWLMVFFLVFLLSIRRDALWLAAAAGAALGVAALYKQNVPVLLGPAWLIAMLAARRGQVTRVRAARLAAVATAATLLIVATVPLYYLALGRFADWRFYNIDAVIIYQGLWQSPTAKVAQLICFIPLRPFLVVGLLYGAFIARRADRSDWAGDLGIFLAIGWLVLFASVAPGLGKAHYLIQGLPAECLLIGAWVAGGGRLVAQARGRMRIGLGALYLVLLVPLVAAGVDLGRGWERVATFARQDAYLEPHRAHGTLSPLVDYIRAHSDPEDLIYVHSEAPEFYFLTQRHPAVSDPTGAWIALVPRQEFADFLLAELQATPPRLIVQLDYRRYWREGETLQKWGPLFSWIRRHYREHTDFAHAQVLEWDH